MMRRSKSAKGKVRGGRPDRPDGDRLHLVLFLAALGGVAAFIRRDVLRRFEPPLSRHGVWGAARGGARSDTRRPRADELDRERGDARDADGQPAAARRSSGGELARRWPHRRGGEGKEAHPPPLFLRRPALWHNERPRGTQKRAFLRPGPVLTQPNLSPSS